MKRILAVLFFAVLAAGYGAVSPAAASRPASAPTAATLSVYINGPRTLATMQGCTWDAVVSGGTTPYTYVWTTVRGKGSGVDEIWAGYFPGSGSLTVTVTDALGATATKTITVTTSYNGPLCP